ncbi:hypothetical protein ANO11243_034110 [Dothideomycetidae sp. 11243]|nr:hypothetical protein ANO11243_034110 [fungal sp. No.11243]
MNGILEEEDAMRECKRTGCTAYPTRRVPGRIAAERAGPPNMHVKQIPPDHSSRSADSEWKIDGGGKCKRREEEEVAWVATGQEDERWVGQENWRRMRRMCIRRRKLQLQRQARAHVQLSGCHCLCLCHCLCRCFCLWIHIQPLSNHRRRTIPRRPASTALDSAVTPGPGVARTALPPLRGVDQPPYTQALRITTPHLLAPLQVSRSQSDFPSRPYSLSPPSRTIMRASGYVQQLSPAGPSHCPYVRLVTPDVCIGAAPRWPLERRPSMPLPTMVSIVL